MKKQSKTKDTPSEIRAKKINYKVGAVKRKVGISAGEETNPGDLFNKAKTLGRPEKVAFMGMV